ncbi:MAG: MFS transporter [Promethearchaeota archaeon]|nr:MAG: MFS transporter [Candidatus Lokiarchaeota archaeon]
MGPQFKKKYYLIFLSSVLGPLSTNALIPLFQQLKTNFVLDSVSFISFAFFVYMFPFAILQLFAGTFSDLTDKKKVVVGGYIVFLFGLSLALLSVLLGNYILFLMGFLFQGIGFSFMNPTILAILAIITPEEKEGLIMGIYNSSAGLGVSGGAILAGVLANLRWELLFFFNPIITVISLILFIFALKNCEALICRSYESNRNKEEDENILEGFLEKLKAVGYQLRENLRGKIILLGILGFFTFFTVITLTNTLSEQISLNLTSLSKQEISNSVSLILTSNGLISIGLSPFTGNILKRVKPIYMIGVGFILMIGIILLPLGNTILAFLLISLTIYIGSAFIWPALFKSSMQLNPEARGTNSAIINSLRFLGYSFVGLVYLFIDIPFLYFIVFAFIILSLGIIIEIRIKQ